MYHSATFIMSGAWHPTRPVSTETSYNTWDDWHLIPTSRPVIAPPEVKTEYESIPIFDGAVDLTQTLTGDICYKYREGEIEFLVDNGHREWYELYSEIADVLHGQFGRIFLEDEPRYYYEGRFTVEQWRSEEHWSYITVGYKLKPTKFAIGG